MGGEFGQKEREGEREGGRDGGREGERKGEGKCEGEGEGKGRRNGGRGRDMEWPSVPASSVVKPLSPDANQSKAT